jgi:hypothetical protein
MVIFFVIGPATKMKNLAALVGYGFETTDRRKRGRPRRHESGNPEEKRQKQSKSEKRKLKNLRRWWLRPPNFERLFTPRSRLRLD